MDADIYLFQWAGTHLDISFRTKLFRFPYIFHFENEFEFYKKYWFYYYELILIRTNPIIIPLLSIQIHPNIPNPNENEKTKKKPISLKTHGWN